MTAAELKEKARGPLAELVEILFHLQNIGAMKYADRLERILIDLKNWRNAK